MRCDHDARPCAATWHRVRCPGAPSKRQSYLPHDKQLLLIRGVPCVDRVRAVQKRPLHLWVLSYDTHGIPLRPSAI